MSGFLHTSHLSRLVVLNTTCAISVKNSWMELMFVSAGLTDLFCVKRLLSMFLPCQSFALLLVGGLMPAVVNRNFRGYVFDLQTDL